MTIRAKLIAAIMLAVIGPVVTIGVALAAFGTLDERSDEVQRAGSRQARALELKFAVPAPWLAHRLGLLEPAPTAPG